MVIRNFNFGEDNVWVSHCNFKRIKGVLEATLIVKVPAPLLVQLLDGNLQLNCSLPHYGVDLFGLLKTFVCSVNGVNFK